jgi:hypothetical protein
LNAAVPANTMPRSVSTGPWAPVAELLGSGKLGTPCARIHREKCSAASFWLSLICGGPPLLGPPPHAFWADSNAGENGLIPELGVIASSPFDDGSGKFVTPCARMQLENLSPCDDSLASVLDFFDEDPQAASASASETTANAAVAPRQVLCVGIQADVLRNRR